MAQHFTIGCRSPLNVLSVLVCGIGISPICAQSPFPEELEVHFSSVTGRASFIKSKQGPLRISPRTSQILGQASDWLAYYGNLFGVTDAASELSDVATEIDDLRFEHSTYAQVFQGIPVYSGVIKIHRKNAAFIAANGNFYRIPVVLNTVPTLDASAASVAAIASYSAVSAEVEHAALIIVDPGWYGGYGIGPHLAYHVVVNDSGANLRYGFFKFSCQNGVGRPSSGRHAGNWV